MRWLVLILVISGCCFNPPNSAIYDRAYRDGKLSQPLYDQLKAEELGWKNGGGKYPVGSEGEARMLEGMIIQQRDRH